MRAMICEHHGGPEQVVPGELPLPEPGPGEVRIRVRACGINFPDVLMVAGRYQAQPPLPFAPGAEVAGEIDLCADDSGFAAGQRVLAFCHSGGLAEYVVVNASQVVAIPDAMPFDIAAAFILTYGTSWHALRQRARLVAGERLLVLGAAGGVGLAAVELGALAGAEVIAVASTEDKRALAADHGAAHTLGYDDLKARLKALTGGDGVDVIFDPVGGDSFEQALRASARGGRALVVGFAAGNIPTVPMNLPLLKGCSIVGVFWGQFTEHEPHTAAANHRQLMRWYVDGRLRPHIDRAYPFGRAADALERLASREARGKVVVTGP